MRMSAVSGNKTFRELALSNFLSLSGKGRLRNFSRPAARLCAIQLRLPYAGNVRLLLTFLAAQSALRNAIKSALSWAVNPMLKRLS